MKKTLLTFTLLAGLSSCTNLSEDLDMIGTQNITQTKSGNLSISENEPAIVKEIIFPKLNFKESRPVS